MENQNVYVKLAAARNELQQKSLKKSGRNSYAGFDYFELADFLPHINQIFAEKKLLSHFFLGKNHARMRIINAENPAEHIDFIMPSIEAAIKGVSQIQNIGGTQTYLRRYLWLSAMEISEADSLDPVVGKDAEKSAPKKPDPQTAETPQKPKSAPQHDYKAELLGMFKTVKEAKEWVKIKTGKDKINQEEAEILTKIRQEEIAEDLPLDPTTTGGQQ